MRWLLALALMAGPVFADARSHAKFTTPRKVIDNQMINAACGPVPVVASTLRDRYSETRIWTRASTGSVRYQYWEGSKTWTILSIHQGTSCVRASGQFGGASS